jgi:hypothetical protein
MIDFYLKAADEAAMNTALQTAGAIDADGNPVERVSLDKIGPFTRFDDAGEAAEYPDYHCNVRIVTSANVGDLAPLDAMSVLPSQPFRVWG